MAKYSRIMLIISATPLVACHIINFIQNMKLTPSDVQEVSLKIVISSNVKNHAQDELYRLELVGSKQ